MKTNIFRQRSRAGYALIMIVGMTAIIAIVLASTMSRTFTNSQLNDRSNQYLVLQNASEAAAEKVVARMGYDFQSYGAPVVTANLGLYKTLVPTSVENSYWANFVFLDATGVASRTSVTFLSNYVGNLPSQYPGLYVSSASQSPVYRVISNVRLVAGTTNLTGAVQEDVLLAQVPINQYAIFYNGLLEFSTAAPMTVNGRVHANGSIYTGSSSTLTLNGTVTATGTISSPSNNGQGPWSGTSAGIFNGNPGSRTNVPTVSLSIGSTNVHAMVDPPPTNGETASSARMYYEAQTILTITNNTVTMQIQAAPATNAFPGTDPGPLYVTSSNTPTALATNFPFLTTNSFTDLRENKTMLTSQIDIAKYAQWIKTNSTVLTKFPSSSSNFPTILFVMDNRATNSSQMTAVRLTNGAAPPVNGGAGFTVATPNPLYVMGNYNCTNSSYLGTTNTSATVPCALMSDALTILSSKWKDSDSANTTVTVRPAASTTVNAAILTGVVPSTGTSTTTFSGGVHNLTRLLEDWSGGGATLTLNTSIMSLFNSTRATHAFVNPNTYYTAPTRAFSFDQNFLSPSKQPPGIPTALVMIRLNWGTPPPNTTTYNVTP